MTARPLAPGLVLFGLLGLLAGLPLLAAPTAALANDPSGYVDGRSLPACEAAPVLRSVAAKQMRGHFRHLPPLRVESFSHVAETRYVAARGPGLRERRWCSARVIFEDGRESTAWYVIEGYASFVGISYGVESCVVGRDLWNVHGGDCSALRIW